MLHWEGFDWRKIDWKRGRRGTRKPRISSRRKQEEEEGEEK